MPSRKFPKKGYWYYRDPDFDEDEDRRCDYVLATTGKAGGNRFCKAEFECWVAVDDDKIPALQDLTGRGYKFFEDKFDLLDFLNKKDKGLGKYVAFPDDAKTSKANADLHFDASDTYF